MATNRLLSGAVAGALLLGAGVASADVFVTASIDKEKTLSVFEFQTISKFIFTTVSTTVSVDAVAEQDVVKNQDNHINFVEDENASSIATIKDTGSTFAGIVLINQSPGFVNNQGNETSDTIARSPSSAGATKATDFGSSGEFAHAQADVQQSNGGTPTESNPNFPWNQIYVGTLGSLNSDTIDNSFDSGSGVLGVNQASGHLNNQNNAVAIAIGDPAVYALGEADLGQFNTFNKVDVIDQTRSDTIQNGTLKNFAGIAQINQSAGSVNNQANVVDIAISVGGTLPFTPHP